MQLYLLTKVKERKKSFIKTKHKVPNGSHSFLTLNTLNCIWLVKIPSNLLSSLSFLSQSHWKSKAGSNFDRLREPRFKFHLFLPSFNPGIPKLPLLWITNAIISVQSAYKLLFCTSEIPGFPPNKCILGHILCKYFNGYFWSVVPELVVGFVFFSSLTKVLISFLLFHICRIFIILTSWESSRYK